MKNTGWFSRHLNQQPSLVRLRRGAGAMTIAMLLAAAPFVAAQTPGSIAPAPETKISTPDGYTAHHSVDVGGRITSVYGSMDMYDTLVNLQSGPRVQGESFEMHALPGNKKALVDDLKAFGSGFGGDPNIFAKLDASKSKYYEFSGLFRRDRQFFDYDLLGNPNIPAGQSIPIGPSASPTGSFAWPQVTQSPFSFNTVRRMTDTDLTIMPLSTFTARFGYSHGTFEGPSLSPSGYSFAKYNAILEEYQRNSDDDFFGALDWKPLPATKISVEEQITHNKFDSYFTLNPAALTLQEADGTPVAINDYDSLSPYAISACNANSIGTTPLLSAPSTGTLPVINPACAVVSSYTRTQPSRTLFPTSILRLQSSSIKNVAMNGNARYTLATMNLPQYYDSYTGLDGTTREQTYIGLARAHRAALAADYGVVWQIIPAFSLSEQIDFSNIQEPGYANSISGVTLTTPATAGNETINYPTLTSTLTAAGKGTITGNPSINTPLLGYFGQSFMTNKISATWDATSRTAISLTYRYGNHVIAQGVPHTPALAVGQVSNGTVTINENGAILNVSVHPTNKLDMAGSVEISYSDNAFTPVAPRQLKHYRFHTIYKPATWASFTGSYNDLERHNNTNNNASAVTAGDDPYDGQLDHVDHSRIFSVGTVIAPNEHYGFDINYSYSDVYTATNICFDNGAQNASTVVYPYPGTATLTSAGIPNVCPGVFTRGSTTQLADWFGRDFMDAPTQYGSFALNMSPIDKAHASVGYRISEVNGTRFYTDARDVNGSLVSSYQSPFVNFAYTVHPGLTLKAEYDYYGYGEGGPSGPTLCSTSTSLTSTVAPCSSFASPTGLAEGQSGDTAARTFRAQNLVLGVHYEF